MKVLFERTKSRLINVKVLFNAGSLKEKKAGTAHLLEHIILDEDNETFKQLKNRANLLNGYTTQDCVVFFVNSVLSEELIYVLQDIYKILFESEVTKEKLERQKKIVLQEIREYSSCEKIEFVNFLSDVSSLPIHSEIGNIESLNNIDIYDVQEYKDKYLTESNCVLKVSGSISRGLCRKIKKHFETSSCDIFSENSFLYSRKEKIVELNLNICHTFILFPSEGLFSLNKIYYELFLIYFFSEISDFWKDIRDENAWSYFIDYETMFIEDSGFLVVQVDSKKSDIHNICESLKRHLNEMCFSNDLFLLAKRCLFKRICDDYDKDVNDEAKMKRFLQDKTFSFNEQVRFLKNITFDAFVDFSKNLIRNGYSLLIEQ